MLPRSYLTTLPPKMPPLQVKLPPKSPKNSQKILIFPNRPQTEYKPMAIQSEIENPIQSYGTICIGARDLVLDCEGNCKMMET